MKPKVSDSEYPDIQFKSREKLLTAQSGRLFLFPNNSALTACPGHNAAKTARGGLNREEDRETETKKKKEKYRHWLIRLTGQTVTGKQ